MDSSQVDKKLVLFAAGLQAASTLPRDHDDEGEFAGLQQVSRSKDSDVSTIGLYCAANFNTHSGSAQSLGMK
ncbi:hypothetical protein NX059_012428 [Plenodomus lindquistii]|nr:hypothetical protein NX059_012428 [Plenodomus lindquistii]